MPTHLAKSSAVCAQLQKSPTPHTTCALCPAAGCFHVRQLSPRKSHTQTRSYAPLTHSRSHEPAHDNQLTAPSRSCVSQYSCAFFWIRSLIICSVSNSSTIKTINVRHTSKESHLRLSPDVSLMHNLGQLRDD